MGAHRCCDCQRTIVSNCPALVAGDPPSPCNWWPEAYSVSIEFSGVSYVRQFNNSQFLKCASPHAPSSQGLAWCRTIDWSWSLSTTIYRVRNAIGSFGSLGIRCPDVAIPDDGLNVAGVGDDCNNNGVPDGNTDCGSTPYFDGSVPSYSSPCCCDSAAAMTGVADRTFTATDNHGVGTQFGTVICQVNQGTTTDSISFSRKCRVLGFCTLGRVRLNPNGPSVPSFLDNTVRFQIAVIPFDSAVDEGSPCQNSEATAWWSSVSSLIVAPSGSVAGSFCQSGSPPRCDEFNIYGAESCKPGIGGEVRVSSAPLILEQPGVVGSMGVGDDFGMPLIYEHGCGPSGGCDAPQSSLDQPYISVCLNTNAINYACTQVTATVTPMQGSI
jgi:hypothetical protein